MSNVINMKDVKAHEQPAIKVATIDSLKVTEHGQLTEVKLNTGRILGGIVAGKVSVDRGGKGALVTLTFLCKPTINGRKLDDMFTGIVAPNGAPIVKTNGVIGPTAEDVKPTDDGELN